MRLFCARFELPVPKPNAVRRATTSARPTTSARARAERQEPVRKVQQAPVPVPQTPKIALPQPTPATGEEELLAYPPVGSPRTGGLLYA